MEGYYPSQGERSYDALRLQKQLSEQTAPEIYANAREVLGDETHDSLQIERLLLKSESSRQDSNILVGSVFILFVALYYSLFSCLGRKKTGKRNMFLLLFVFRS